MAEDDLSALRDARRWHDVFGALTLRAAGSGDVEGRVRDWNEAGMLMLEKFANQAEAIRCFEASLSLDRDQPEILARLRGLHERRRDWDALERLARTEDERAAVRALRREHRSLWKRLF
jgi:hypothetical protein